MIHAISSKAPRFNQQAQQLSWTLHFVPDADMHSDLIESSVTSEGVTPEVPRTFPEALPMLGETDAA